MYTHVLVGTDGSISSVRAVGTAARLAQAHHAKLTIAHSFGEQLRAIDDGAKAAKSDRRSTPRAAAERLVNAAADHAQDVAAGVLEIDTRAEAGTQVAVLSALIDELSPDAVIVGNGNVRRALSRTGHGHQLIRRAESMVIVDTSSAARATTRRALA